MRLDFKMPQKKKKTKTNGNATFRRQRRLSDECKIARRKLFSLAIKKKILFPGVKIMVERYTFAFV